MPSGIPMMPAYRMDSAVRSIVRTQAKRRGWLVDEVSNAEDALGLELQHFAAILCDRIETLSL